MTAFRFSKILPAHVKPKGKKGAFAQGVFMWLICDAHHSGLGVQSYQKLSELIGCDRQDLEHALEFLVQEHVIIVSEDVNDGRGDCFLYLILPSGDRYTTAGDLLEQDIRHFWATAAQASGISANSKTIQKSIQWTLGIARDLGVLGDCYAISQVKWSGMKSAPKNGTFILLISMTADEPSPCVAVWHDLLDIAIEKPGAGYWKIADPYGFETDLAEPTHWAPIPTPVHKINWN